MVGVGRGAAVWRGDGRWDRGIRGVERIHRRAGSPVAKNHVCLVERKSGEKDVSFYLDEDVYFGGCHGLSSSPLATPPL